MRLSWNEARAQEVAPRVDRYVYSLVPTETSEMESEQHGEQGLSRA